MFAIDPYTILSPEYEEFFKEKYGKQPKYIPTGFKNNTGCHVTQPRTFSRTWTSNPKYKKK